MWYFGSTQRSINLALNKTAYQSDVWKESVGPGLAVDGVLAQSYGAGLCTHSSALADAFWEVDLGKVHFIDNVTIFNRRDCCATRLRDVELYISTESKIYKKYGFHEGVVWSAYTFELANKVFGRWVRITRIPSVIDYLTLCEVQVFGYENSQYIEPVQLEDGNQTTMQTLSAIQCAYICLKASGCKQSDFRHNQNMCVFN